ncbi:MAG: DUF4340 domain-containing protein [Opitutaceae bacterium]|nr:DUF4340 domain-containing protein [Opitutaceae bacterium]
MKLKTLLVVVTLLALASLAAYYVGRPPKPTGTDPRLNQPLVAGNLLEQASALKITENGKTVSLAKGAGGTWSVAEYYGFPADFEKVARLAGDLTAAKVERLVTQNPERIKGFNFGNARLVFSDASGKELASLDLGKNAEGGGRLVRYGTEEKAYLSRLNAYLDTEPKNWADATLVSLKPEDISRVELTFGDGSAPVVATRAKKEDAFTATDAPAGERLRTSRVDSVISSLASLRFSDTSDPADANAVAAKAVARTVTLGTFDGKRVTLQIGRKPEQKIVKAPEAKKDGTTGPSALGSVADLAKAAAPAGAEKDSKSTDSTGPAKVLEPVTETVPAGPVYVFIAHSDATAPINGLMAKRAFQVYESTFTGLPQARAELFEPIPPAPPAPTPAPAAAPAPAGK